MPSVHDLRILVVDAARCIEADDATNSTKKRRTTAFQNVVGDVRSMYSKVVENGDVVQAASQFNGLEFPSPNAIPEEGIEQTSVYIGMFFRKGVSKVFVGYVIVWGEFEQRRSRHSGPNEGETTQRTGSCGGGVPVGMPRVFSESLEGTQWIPRGFDCC